MPRRHCCAGLSRSVVSDSLQPLGLQPARLLCPWGFSRQEHWSGLPCPSGNLSDPEIDPGSPALQADSLPAELPGKPKETLFCTIRTSRSQDKPQLVVEVALLDPLVSSGPPKGSQALQAKVTWACAPPLDE